MFLHARDTSWFLYVTSRLHDVYMSWQSRQERMVVMLQLGKMAAKPETAVQDGV